MPTTVELLRAELKAQAAEEAQPPIRTVDEARAFINNEHPAPTVNIALEMCVLSMKELENKWRVELINLEDAPQFSTVLEMYEPLDVARRSKFVFVLTIWKNHSDNLNQLDYRQGFAYRFEKVHSLKLLYGNPVGSLQIRHRLQAEPLVDERTAGVTPQPPPRMQDVVDVAEQQVANGHPTIPITNSVLLDQGEVSIEHTPPQTPSNRDEDVVVAAPGSKSSAKRNTRKQDVAEPAAKQRKQNPKALHFYWQPRAPQTTKIC